jgi:hypothetical protein
LTLASEVGAVAAVEAERLHRVREQARMLAPGAAAAVLVELHLDERHLRAPAQARNGERVRVGLLELVRRLVHEHVAELVGAGAGLEEARE